MTAEESVLELCKQRGGSRRRFMQFCGAIAVGAFAAAAAAHAVGHVVRDPFHPGVGNGETVANEKTEETTTEVH